MAPRVLIIGGSGAVGKPLVDEFLKQRSHFERVAVLADPSKISRFADAEKKGVEIVVGSFLDASSYKGYFLFPSERAFVEQSIQGLMSSSRSRGTRQ
jgi:nucleoside-diphosphate-sugar epimerase